MAEDEDRSAIIAHFQEITGVDDAAECVQYLSAHGWDLEAAVQVRLSHTDPPHPPPSHPHSSPPSPSQPPQQSPAPVVQEGGAVPGSWWQWLSSLALFPLRFIVTTASEILAFIVQLLFGTQPLPASNPRGDVASFLAHFENSYGTTHPDFLHCSYTEALAEARQRLRFLLVYLHSPQHQDTPHFCRSVLATEGFAQFARSSSLLCWGVSVDSEEGVRVSHTFRENTFPFFALVCLQRSRMVVCARVEGAAEAKGLVGRLQAAMRDNEAEMVAERVERDRRDQDKWLREDQDRQYALSLEADRLKQREREQRRVEEEEREARERDRVEQEQRKEEEFTASLHRRRSRLPPEPSPSSPLPSLLVSLRLPNGERMERKFSSTDHLQSVYDFAYTSDSVPRQFTLVTNYPRRELRCGEGGGGREGEGEGPELGELGLGPRCILFIQNDSDD